MRILLTGASGFVGGHVVKALQDAGHDLLLISRKPHRDLDQTRWIEADFSEPDSLRNELEGFAPEVVFHLAWEGIPDFSEATCTKNVLGSLRLLGLVGSLTSVRRIVSAGSCWEYGDHAGACVETLNPTPGNWFTWAKEAVFRYQMRLGAERDLRWYWPRIFFVYGTGQRSQALIPSVTTALRAGKIPDVRSPFASNDFIHVSDVAAGLARFVDTAAPSGIYNLGSGAETTVLEVVKTIEFVLGHDNRASLAIEHASVGTPLPKPGIYADTAKAQSALQWQAQTSLRRGLAQFVDGY
jgi:nucleoside-diphosphate-sugar epimerase